MTGDRSRLLNFMKKFIKTVRFRNDYFGAIMGYGDYVVGESVISRVYYVEGLGHNLFSVGQFCDSDLEVTFRKHSCYVRDTDEPPRAERPGSPAQAVQAPVNSAGTPLSTTIDQDAPSPHISPSSSALQSHSLPPGIAAEPHFMEDHNVATVDNNPFVNDFAPEPHSEASSSRDISSTESPHVAHDLLSLQKHKKTSLVDQYIFQRRVSEPTGSSRHYESPYALIGQSDNEEESKKTGSDAGAQAEGQAGSNSNETSEGQAGSNPDETFKGQAGLDPGDAEAKVQYISSPVVHVGSDLKHMDLDVADVSPQPSMEQLDEGFTATVYQNVQENLKLVVEEPVLLEEPTRSSGTLSSL
nr:integrase, catalytic region, zinc finger, CCHC-type, peptidase aspartic, catalytic [Tanacetum cinerariifolium]